MRVQGWDSQEKHYQNYLKSCKYWQDIESLLSIPIKQTCNEGKLNIEQCPPNYLWDVETQSCSLSNSDKCDPEKFWSLQTGLNLEDCIGYQRGICSIGFVELVRAQKYCEQTDGCVGVKEDKCTPSIGINIECIGTRWRPYRTIIDGNETDQIFIIQKIALDVTDDADIPGFNLKHDWSEPQTLYFSGCADEYYNEDSSCKTKFKTVDAAMSYCEQLDTNCNGVAQQSEYFVAVAEVSHTDSYTFDQKNSNKANRGSVFEKLNRIFETILDSKTKNTMLVEYWGESISGSLASCSTDEDNFGNCIPQFTDLFEAQYYCETIGDLCSGVTEENEIYTTRSKTEIIARSSAKSWMKAVWCSNDTPSMAIKLPAIFNIQNVVEIIWPVINFKEIIEMMQVSPLENLNVIRKKFDWTNENYKRYAIDLRINADTVIFDYDATIYNVKSVIIKARKVLINKQTTLTFRQSNAISSEWFNSTAPDAGSIKPPTPHGNNGQHGVNGFEGTHFRLEAGCINGGKNQLNVKIVSGSGQSGQHGSRGLDGVDGEPIPPKTQLVPRSSSCKGCSCDDCCWGRPNKERHSFGEDCTPEKTHYQGTDGGNGGNGGNGGRPGNPGKV